MKVTSWLLSCEHGGKRVPPAYRSAFRSASARSALDSHRGCDIGALRLATALAAGLQIPLISSSVTRLLVDLNRSIGHPRLFSEFSSRLDTGARRTVIERHYLPHRERIAEAVAAGDRGLVCHIAVHSFTGKWRGTERRADIGLLYDPARPLESALCRQWRDLLREAAPVLRVRRNYPYRGTTDGLTTALRRRFPPARYAGIELEVNQALLGSTAAWRRCADAITAGLLALRERCS